MTVSFLPYLYSVLMYIFTALLYGGVVGGRVLPDNQSPITDDRPTGCHPPLIHFP